MERQPLDALQSPCELDRNTICIFYSQALEICCAQIFFATDNPAEYFIHINDPLRSVHRPLSVRHRGPEQKCSLGGAVLSTDVFPNSRLLEIVYLRDSHSTNVPAKVALTVSLDLENERVSEIRPDDSEIAFEVIFAAMEKSSPATLSALPKVKSLDAKMSQYRMYKSQGERLMGEYYRTLILQEFQLLSPSLDGYPFFETQTPVRKKDTLCILAAGPSVNDISPEQWALIEASDSLGLNWFYLHDYVTDFYQIEVSHHNRDFLYRVLAAKARDGAMPSTCLYDVSRSKACEFDYKKVPFAHTNFCLPVRFAGLDQKELSDICQYHGYAGRHLFPSTLFHHGGGLSQAISFGLVLGYTKIVLFGVDLCRAGHFFDVGTLALGAFYDEARQIRDEWQTAIQSQTPGDHDMEKYLHPSADPQITRGYNEIPITQVMQALLAWARAVGTTIEIANSDAMKDVLPRLSYGCATFKNVK